MKKRHFMGLYMCMAFCLTLSLAPVQRVLAGEDSIPDRTNAAPDRGVTINVYNWGEYIANGTDGSPDLNEEFTRRTGIRVNYTRSEEHTSELQSH